MLLGFILVGKVFGKAFLASLIGLNERKKLMGSETRFSWKF